MAFSISTLRAILAPDELGEHGVRKHKFTMATTSELSIRNNDGHLVVIAAPADTGITPSPATGRALRAPVGRRYCTRCARWPSARTTGNRDLGFDDEAKPPYLRAQYGLDVEQYDAALGAVRGNFHHEYADDAAATDLLRDEERFVKVKMILLDSSFLLIFCLMFGRIGARGNGADDERAAASVTREHFVLHSAQGKSCSNRQQAGVQFRYSPRSEI